MIVALAGCGVDGIVPDDGGVETEPDATFVPDAEAQPTDATAEPRRCLTYSPAVYFHEVTLGRREWLRFAIQNTCREPRRLLSVRLIDGESAFELDPLPLPLWLDREETSRISVRFAPRAPKDYEAQVAFEIDDVEQPAFRVRIFGVGVGGELKSLPSRLEFEDVPVGCRTASRAVALWNEGPGPMYIFSVALEGPDAAAFAADYQASLPTDVPAFEGLPVALSFRPTREGPHEASLLITYNGRESPARVPLSASAVGGLARVEHFDVPARPKHDLLFLVPPPSIARGEAAGLLDFAREARATSEVDLRVLVAPSGARDAVIGEPIACQGFSRWLDFDLIEPQLLDTLLRCMLSVASSEEPPRSSAALVSALETSFVRPSSEAGPLRVDASLHVVLTTFDDRWKVPLPFVLSFLESLPPRAPLQLLVHAYDVPTPAEPSLFGARHYALVEATGGDFIDQRSDAWPRFFERLAERLRDGARSLRLKARAREGSVEVRLQSTSSTIAFTVGEVGDRIDLSSFSGGPVEVRYEARCAP